jgi:hypothetical protein
MLYLNKSNISVQVPPVLPGVKREPGANPGRSGHCKWGAALSMERGHTFTKECPQSYATGFVNGLGRREIAVIHESGDLPGQ